MSPDQQASCKLNVIIVGCGISGLSLAYLLGKAGHNVIILEAASTLGEIGAGLVIGPNASKLLCRWGLKEKLDAVGVRSESVFLRKFDTGEPLAILSSGRAEEDYGAPQYQLHRADLQILLRDLVSNFPNVNIRVNSHVASVCPNPPLPHVELQSGEVISGDIVLGSDGVRSVVRACVLGRPDPPTPSGDTVYRTILDAEHFLEDLDLKPFIEEAGVYIWNGHGMRVVGYSVRAQKNFNLVMIRADTEPGIAADNAKEIIKAFEGWDPQLRKIQAFVTSVIASRLLIRDPLQTWIHSSGLVAVIGDAAHPMTPLRAQGACMAIEDAAVLGSLFSRITSKSQIPALLKAYETIRYDRATAVQLISADRKQMHIPNFMARNRSTDTQDQSNSMPNQLANNGSSAIETIMWGSRQEQGDAIFRYDAERATEEWWSEHGPSIVCPSGVA